MSVLIPVGLEDFVQLIRDYPSDPLKGTNCFWELAEACPDAVIVVSTPGPMHEMRSTYVGIRPEFDQRVPDGRRKLEGALAQQEFYPDPVNQELWVRTDRIGGAEISTILAGMFGCIAEHLARQQVA